MMIKVRLSSIFLLFVSIAFFSCASKDFKEPGKLNQPRKKTTIAFKVNFPTTWKAVEQVANNYPVISAIKESGTILTDWIKTKSDKLYSGYDENRIPYTIRYKFKIKVRPTSKGTIVNIQSKEQYFTDSVTAGIDFSGSVYQWIDTESSTHKEAAFLAKVRDILFPKSR